MKMSVAKKYESLLAVVKKYVQDVRNTKLTVAFTYRVSEQPKQLTVGAPPQQFNVIEVRTLLAHVQTAEQLGYMTLLKSEGSEKLVICYLEQQPRIPWGFDLSS